ncbi:MAG: GC-type dockerin domain-anchored protein [Planctomycetota bacterium]
MLRVRAVLLACCSFAAPAAGQAEYALVELADLPGGANQSLALQVDDGGIVAGQVSGADGLRAAIWDESGVPMVLGTLPGGVSSSGFAIVDGMVAGQSTAACGETSGFVWTASGGMVAVGPEGCTFSRAESINAAGQTLVKVGPSREAFVWPEPGGAGAPRPLETWGGAVSTSRVLPDGGVVGGAGRHPLGGIVIRAVEWRADGTTRVFPRLDDAAPGADTVHARTDAGLYVGLASVGSITRAAIWDGAGTVLDAGAGLGDGVSSALLDANESGVAVGRSAVGAIRWDGVNGAVPLLDLVDTSGDGWELTNALSINERGWICGNGRSPAGGSRGFLLIPIAEGCPADLDGDGELTIFDFLAFQNLFDAGAAAADLDGDGSLTLFDFLAFQNLFDAGCP